MGDVSESKNALFEGQRLVEGDFVLSDSHLVGKFGKRVARLAMYCTVCRLYYSLAHRSRPMTAH